MTNIANSIPSGDFSIGGLLGESFYLLHKALPRFLALAVLPVIPTLLALLAMPAADPESMPFMATGGGALASILSMVLLFAIQGAMIYGAFSEMRGRSFTIGEALSKGFARFWPVVGVSLLTGLGVSIGLLLLLAPGFWIMCVLYAAVAACVVEELGVSDSMSRSSQLTKGYRWQILGLLLINIVVSLVIRMVATLIATTIGGFMFGQIVGIATQVYVAAYGSVLGAIAYYRLRSIKEGIGIDRIAHVFD